MTTVHISNGKQLENDAVADKKQRSEPEPLLISDFEAGQAIAARLIPKHHSEIASANILFLSRNRAAKQGEVRVPGSVKKASPLERHLGGHFFDGDKEPDFIITVALDVWNDLQPPQRTALIDHFLTQCFGKEDEKTGNMKYVKRPPQVQEFPEVAERHGRWNDGLVELGACLDKK
ncbi:MAG: hypothetical protein BWY99_01623 [Synergistetes bacterium ADurb.BinA166]|nr:MAG: hypothetical protein BWY99_01623 [Synergistetes bacterium ADurb.BinA166]